MPRIVTDIEAASKGSMSAINNWVNGRVELRTQYEGGQGKQRRYFYDNVLELAFLVALTKAGLKASTAIAYADQFRQLAMADELPRLWGFADGDPNRSKSDSSDAISQWEAWFPDAASISIVPVLKIKERVDAYFDQHGVEVD